ncbi:hypothetical protein [Nostoc sp. UIC 10630]|nr:hypothetical protein [Nostoc sp. UIC 10630]NEU79989.1 hypothetical protein [Nostoc sp. UIC 10630]
MSFDNRCKLLSEKRLLVYLRSPNNCLKECQGLQCDGVPAHRRRSQFAIS